MGGLAWATPLARTLVFRWSAHLWQWYLVSLCLGFLSFAILPHGVLVGMKAGATCHTSLSCGSFYMYHVLALRKPGILRSRPP